MPTYHYRCSTCEQHLEVVQSMTDDPITECAACGGTMQKVLQPVGIVLKGSGFYRTDNRGGSKKSSSSGDGASSSDSSSDSGSKSDGAGGSKSETKTEKKSEKKSEKKAEKKSA